MTPASRRPGPVISSAAFTLLEMTVVMFVMAVIAGISLFSFRGVTEEEILRQPAAEFQRMVLEAMRRTALEEQPQVIEFDTQGFSMRYREKGAGREASPEGNWIRKVRPPQDMRITLKRWRGGQFTPAAGQRLELLPGGVCEPLTIRFERSASWLEISLHPLTGGVREEALYISPEA